MNQLKEERHRLIIQWVNEEKRVSVAKMAKKFSVTPETIRRDLTELEELEQITRVHGGAVLYTTLEKEQAYLRKLDINRAEKEQIAFEAISRIEDGDTIGIDVGTTTFHIADLIQNVQNLTVVTNSIAAADRFNQAIEEKRVTGKVILLGGFTNPAQSSVSGAMTLEWLSHMHMDKAFISCGGIVGDTIYDYDLDESLVSAKMMARSKKNILLVDSSKIGIPSFFSFGDASHFDEVISNQPCPKEWKEWYKRWIIAKRSGSEC
ncbi:DeoR/GlpR family DNA-binding transcription regulator [Peribacillus butanolivorans]|uniref:DeoR/GlpR family DNA-binding transcription regulator n=1 Tax=Peribacillus TaxID=2675229 RepID=UPI0019147CA2|nr:MULTISPECIES: DeoR/GlpR family DNA-binding transcription regulator [unclassified Peribacillus]MBK5442188.1 DeoR/GlpR transcriptional regulator [Peribacillus sp. TH24]MBK5463037.1 DeoR/GlpR transcriptional regulator [Peribacillus sp. TH27]MBK5483622.1 DeoR/GlpR transcriptional regulator [Peribacillus sp. TH16]MBK5501245.1 DeoR/GlpR transcriptional regulator [Peribacillus sp. TH14]WMX53785.1 DeoR/GlpR family DNA-binding transcription regulator [Peribacillus sp. R9-11]